MRTSFSSAEYNRGHSFSIGERRRKGSKVVLVDERSEVFSIGIVEAVSEIGSGNEESIIIIGWPFDPMVFSTGVSGLV